MQSRLTISVFIKVIKPFKDCVILLNQYQPFYYQANQQTNNRYHI